MPRMRLRRGEMLKSVLVLVLVMLPSALVAHCMVRAHPVIIPSKRNNCPRRWKGDEGAAPQKGKMSEKRGLFKSMTSAVAVELRTRNALAYLGFVIVRAVKSTTSTHLL